MDHFGQFQWNGLLVEDRVVVFFVRRQSIIFVFRRISSALVFCGLINSIVTGPLVCPSKKEKKKKSRSKIWAGFDPTPGPSNKHVLVSWANQAVGSPLQPTLQPWRAAPTPSRSAPPRLPASHAAAGSSPRTPPLGRFPPVRHGCRP